MTELHRPGAPYSPRLIHKTLKYKENQEHIVRRLGVALVLHWDALSDEAQDMIIDQAAFLDDRDPAALTSEEVEAFVRNVKLTALPKAATGTKAED